MADDKKSNSDPEFNPRRRSVLLNTATLAVAASVGNARAKAASSSTPASVSTDMGQPVSGQSAPGLVIPDRRPSPFHGKIGMSYADSTPDWPKTRLAPQGAPNVVLILLDDVGFGAASTFGGPIPTPTADRLAAQGLRYTQFNTTALCSPTRSAFLTGHNHHEEGFGVVAEGSTGFHMRHRARHHPT